MAEEQAEELEAEHNILVVSVDNNSWLLVFVSSTGVEDLHVWDIRQIGLTWNDVDLAGWFVLCMAGSLVDVDL